MGQSTHHDVTLGAVPASSTMLVDLFLVKLRLAGLDFRRGIPRFEFTAFENTTSIER